MLERLRWVALAVTGVSLTVLVAGTLCNALHTDWEVDV